MGRWCVGHDGDDTDPTSWLQVELPKYRPVRVRRCIGLSIVGALSLATLKRRPTLARGEAQQLAPNSPRLSNPSAGHVKAKRPDPKRR
jgi:hypothetical protein